MFFKDTVSGCLFVQCVFDGFLLFFLGKLRNQVLCVCEFVLCFVVKIVVSGYRTNNSRSLFYFFFLSLRFV